MDIAQHMDAVITLVVTIGVLAGLIWNRWPAEWLMMAAAVLLILLGVISPTTFLSGFANPGIMTIGALFVVAAGVQETGALRWMLERLLGRPTSPSSALARLMPITSLVSAFLNNTPVVALFIGLVQGWCARMKISPSRLLMPMSYAAILMLFTGYLLAVQARASIDGGVLVVIAAALALGQAMPDSGAAQVVADQLMQFGDGLPFLVLVYITTTLFTEIITNNASAMLMFPIAMTVSVQSKVSFMPYVIAIMYAASASFLTPPGCQGSLMVIGPGGYKASDFMRIGLSMSLIIGLLSVVLSPVIWPVAG
ncbi:SLC13 family permease [Cobetia sp. 14N.309.X.WAT.E.A4]|uniref:SLC13 family permease n=1 Tax=Cobetia sp. 14N.309.X.WAT.E.A4 TaxID=2998323 RepID=UPI0025AEFBE9|nr:SLC13 family permease [Cobetia sp. 14N.309.X.WAT.E.A4]